MISIFLKNRIYQGLIILSLCLLYTSAVFTAAKVDHHSLEEVMKHHSAIMLGFAIYLACIHVTAYYWVTNYRRQKRNNDRLEISSAVFNNAKEGMVIADKNNVIIDVNPAFTAITRMNKDSLLGSDAIGILAHTNGSMKFYEIDNALSRTGEWRGEAWCRQNEKSNCLIDLNITTTLADDNKFYHIYNLTDITVNAKQREEIKKLESYDALTSLPNRNFLKDRLEEAMMTSRQNDSLLGVCCIDLDGFKHINNVLGKTHGDATLIDFSKRLSNFAGKVHTVARTGGDEFVVLLENISSKERIIYTVERMLSLLQMPAYSDLNVIKATASIGVAIYPDDDSDSEALVRHADAAMFEAKLAGRNQFQIFDSKAKKAQSDKMEWVARLMKGIRTQEMSLYYQPKMDISTGRILGFEALIRWNHPDKGVMTPDSFLPWINGDSLIKELDEWVIREAFTQLRKWKETGLETVVSVNVTSESLLSPDFVDKLVELCEEYSDIHVSKIQFEVLETTFLEDMDFAKSQLSKIRNLGIMVALDDFGTGYSSLGYLRNLPTDYIKIDRSFVKGILEDDGDKAIVEGIIQLSKTFKMKVVAEGVEDSEILSMLGTMQCDIAQGYYLSKPIPAESVFNWLSDRNRT